jgi:hypothetical protein
MSLEEYIQPFGAISGSKVKMAEKKNSRIALKYVLHEWVLKI